MAIAAPIESSHEWFIGEDKDIEIDVNQKDGTTAQVMTGWALTWELLDSAGGTVLLTKTVGSGITIGDSDDADADDDRATMAIGDGDTEAASLPDGPGNYYHALRRTDVGSEALLAYGGVVLKRASVS